MILNYAIKTYSRNVLQPILRYTSNNVKASTAEKIATMTPNELVKNTVHVSDWNKRLLVFAGRYKSFAEVPDVVPFEIVAKARNNVRVKVANYMIALTVVGCILAVISGKNAAERGESVVQRNIDWHREYNEQAKQEAQVSQVKK